MRAVIHSYAGSFDSRGRLSIVPATDGTNHTELETPMVSIYFGQPLSDDQKALLRQIAQLLEHSQ